MKKTFIAACMAVAALLSACQGGQGKANLKTDIDTLSYEMGMASSATPEELAQYLQMQGLDSTYVKDFLKGVRDGMQAGEDSTKIAYNLGVQAGMGMSQRMSQMEQQVFADSTTTLNRKAFWAGFQAVVKNKSALKVDGQVVDKNQAGMLANEGMQRMAAKAAEKKYAAQKQASEAFMDKKAKEEGVKLLRDGIYYKVVTPGTTRLVVSDTTTVLCHYELSLPDGSKLESSRERGPEPVLFQPQNLIPGMKSVLKAMPLGATWEVYIPWSQGYGAQPNGQIPPFSALIFKVEVIGTK